MERTDQKLTALQNQMVSLQRLVEELQSKSCTTEVPPCAPPVPPPPPPPPMPPRQTERLERVSAIGSISGLSARLTQASGHDWTQAKKQRPSMKDLVQRKKLLKATSIQRSPGGTPLTHRVKGENEESSPEDNAIATVMKKALKKKFKYLRPMSPESPIERSPNDQDFSF